MTDNFPSKIELIVAIEKHQDGLSGVQTKDIAAEVDSSIADVRTRLIRLADQNLVVEQVCDSGSRWRLTESGRVFRGP